MTFQPPEQFNIADYFLDARIREGRGDRTALLTDDGALTYHEVQQRSHRYATLLREAGVEPEQRVIIALPDGPEYVAALFGVLKIGAVVVMVNPHLRGHEVSYFFEYTRARAALVTREAVATFGPAAEASSHLQTLLVVDDDDVARRLEESTPDARVFPSHRDDAAIWLFSGGTTGQPKAVVQSHASFAYTTECYAKQVIGYTEEDVTVSVPKLFFGYATGSNLLFPFAVGAATVLFPARCTPDVLFAQIARHRPTILVNVPTMVNHMVTHPEAGAQDLGCLRLATSAGEALPEELHARWRTLFGVELLDGLGTAEMWHIFISNRPGAVRPGTLGTVVPGFEVKACDEFGHPVPPGEMGALWVRGGARAQGYWQQMAKTQAAFRGEWYVSGDMIAIDDEGFVRYGGRADDMLKIAGKWLSPQEVEGCLLEHPSVADAAVVGVTDASGLTVPQAFVVAEGTAPADLEPELRAYAEERLATYKQPRGFTFLPQLPRTHLGKVDRGALRRDAEAS
jgi:benzoate-CoA ligase family protein